VREQAIFKVYVSALYLPARSDDSEAILSRDWPRRLVLYFLRNVSMKQLTTSTNDAIRDTLTVEERRPLASRMAQLIEFLETLPDIKEGTEIVIDYLPNHGRTIRIDGEAQHRIPGADFNQALTRVWLGERPKDAKLKKAMLGLY
jgi:long-chain acyl-CoA synthetase